MESSEHRGPRGHRAAADSGKPMTGPPSAVGYTARSPRHRCVCCPPALLFLLDLGCPALLLSRPHPSRPGLSSHSSSPFMLPGVLSPPMAVKAIKMLENPSQVSMPHLSPRRYVQWPTLHLSFTSNRLPSMTCPAPSSDSHLHQTSSPRLPFLVNGNPILLAQAKTLTLIFARSTSNPSVNPVIPTFQVHPESYCSSLPAPPWSWSRCLPGPWL